MAPHSADAVVAMVSAIASDTSRCTSTCASEGVENVHATASTAQTLVPRLGRIHMLSPPRIATLAGRVIDRNRMIVPAKNVAHAASAAVCPTTAIRQAPRRLAARQHGGGIELEAPVRYTGPPLGGTGAGRPLLRMHLIWRSKKRLMNHRFTDVSNV